MKIPDPPYISATEAIQKLQEGQVIGVPTETVYGLAARIDDPKAVEKIFSTKERPFFDPLIVHVASAAEAAKHTAEWPTVAQLLAKEFWPGPLTLVLPKAAHINPMITSGLQTVGVRWPKHPLTEEIINGVGVPLAAPSANRFGKTSPTRPEHVLTEFHRQVPVVDGGVCEIGLESTVVEISGKALFILRPGAITMEMIRECLATHKITIPVERKSSLAAPGNVKHHYMPEIPVVLVTEGSRDQADDFLQKTLPIAASQCVVLDLGTDAALAARGLYENFRRLGQSDAKCILIHQRENQTGQLWSAIWDRIGRAASYVI